MKLKDIPQYILLEEKGRYGLSFGKSPVMPITEDIRSYLKNLKKGEEIIVKANDAGTESTYCIVDMQVNINPTYKDGILQIFVVRCSASMTIRPGTYQKEKQSKAPTNPCGEQPIGTGGWIIPPMSLPNISINDIMSVQPMSQPSGLAFYTDFKCGEPNKNGDIFTKEAMDKAMKKWNDRHLPSKYKI